MSWLWPRLRLRQNASQTEQRSELDESPYPTKQLEIIHKELDRQRAAVASRRSGLHTRGAVLVTASGILAALQSTIWLSGWQFISIILAVLAAGFGLLALRPMTGPESRPAVLFEKHLSNEPYEIEWRIVKDNLEALRAEDEALGKIAKTVGWGYYTLFATWLAIVIVAALDALGFI